MFGLWCRLPVLRPPGGLSPARRQAAEPGRGHAGSCLASELRVGFELKVLEVEINPSLSPSPSLSFLRKPSSSPAAPSCSGRQLPPDLSCAQVEREGEEERGGRWGSVTHLQKTCSAFWGLNGWKLKKRPRKPAPVDTIILLVNGGKKMFTCCSIETCWNFTQRLQLIWSDVAQKE